MSYCLNPFCQNCLNLPGKLFCHTCGAKLLLKDRYRAIRLIGQGGFGRTFLAIDEDKPSKPHCVIKQFYPQGQDAKSLQKAAELFEQEAVRLDSLGEHPQIAELLAHCQQEQRQYLVLEYIPGPNLEQALMTETKFNELQIRHLLTNLLPVLAFIHDHHVIHRDIKPANIIHRLPEPAPPTPSHWGDLVLVDFGAAKYASETVLGKTGTVIGSTKYVAPEQAIGRATFASDLYSLGVTCIHLLTGVSPFDLFDVGEDAWVWRQFLSQPVSDSFGQILDQLIAKGTNQRYHSAAQVLADLNQLEELPSVLELPLTPAPPPISLPPIWLSNTVTSVPPSQLGAGSSPTRLIFSNPDYGAGTWTCIRTLTGHRGSISSLAYGFPGGFSQSLGEAMIVSGGSDKTIKIWDLETGVLQHTLKGHRQSLLSVILSADGQYLASGSGDGIIQLWNAASGTPLLSIVAHTEPLVSLSLAFTPDQQYLISGSSDHKIKIWRVEDGTLERVLQHSRGINAIAISPNGQYLASGSSDNTIRLWDLTTGELIQILADHSRDVNSVIFSPQGDLLVSGSSDLLIKVWASNTGFLQSTLSGHLDWVRVVTFSADGQWLISGGADQMIKIWQISTGQLLNTLSGHKKDVNTLVLSVDGYQIISGSSDGTIKVWQFQS